MEQPTSPKETKSPLPSSRIILNKQDAKALSVGESTKIAVNGKVTAIQECYDHKDMFEVTLEGTGEGDYNDMSPEEMRKKLPVAER